MPLHLPLASKLKQQLVALAPSQVSQFVRQSPLLTGAIVGGTGLITGGGIIISQQIRKKKATKLRPKRRTFRPRVSRVKRVSRVRASHRSPRHRGHKRVTFTTKTGEKVRFLVRGEKRSPKHKSRKSRRFVKGSLEAKRFMAKLRRMRR